LTPARKAVKIAPLWLCGLARATKMIRTRSRDKLLGKQPYRWPNKARAHGVANFEPQSAGLAAEIALAGLSPCKFLRRSGEHTPKEPFALGVNKFLRGVRACVRRRRRR
jgi:hypothetical protein